LRKSNITFWPRPLHQVGLYELKREGEDENPDVQAPNLSDASQWIAAEAVADPRVRVGRLCQVFIDSNLGEERAENVQARFQDDRRQRHDYVPLVRTQIRQQAAHKPPVVRFS
jgi:hypothetical protein